MRRRDFLPLFAFALFLLLTVAVVASAEQRVPQRFPNPFNENLINPFPPPPTSEDARTLMDAWARDDTQTKLDQILAEMTKVQAEIRKLRKDGCGCP